MFATVSPAEWIIDDICFVYSIVANFSKCVQNVI